MVLLQVCSCMMLVSGLGGFFFPFFFRLMDDEEMST